MMHLKTEVSIRKRLVYFAISYYYNTMTVNNDSKATKCGHTEDQIADCSDLNTN